MFKSSLEHFAYCNICLFLQAITFYNVYLVESFCGRNGFTMKVPARKPIPIIECKAIVKGRERIGPIVYTTRLVKLNWIVLLRIYTLYNGLILSNYFSFYLASAVTYAPKAIFCMHLAVTNRPKFLKNGKVIMINPFIAEFTKRYIVFLAAVLKYLNIRKTGGWQWEAFIQ